jgi:hypothetical protein
MNLWGEKSGHKAEKEKEAWLHMVGTREIGGERGWEGDVCLLPMKGEADLTG